jgi:HKD family nuclease
MPDSDFELQEWNETSAICQPSSRVIDQLVTIVESGSWTHIDVAVAYAVVGGVQLLQQNLGSSAAWSAMSKRWLVGIDWCRSQPTALAALNALPNSSVRIFDGETLVDRSGCKPTVTYHPKGFITKRVDGRRVGSRGLLLGSANLSFNGLRVGNELNLWFAGARDSGEPDSFSALSSVASWFAGLWATATPYGLISSRYAAMYKTQQASSGPAVTDDDVSPISITTGRRGLTERDLVRLRSFDRFWIDTGRLYSNLGEARSGNQLELKRFSRVFFGFPALDMSVNTRIGAIDLTYLGARYPDRHLRYGDNGMDKLDLPVPGGAAPTDYRDVAICFTRVLDARGRLSFRMNIASSSDRATWRRQSQRLDSLFRMGGRSTREFGVF